MKIFFTLLFISSFTFCRAQKVDSLFVHLYTDSLKKGTYNYINVDGLLSNGSWLPLDSNHVEFKCNVGQFYGNQLWVDTSIKEEKISIDIILKSDTTQHKHFDMYIKKLADPIILPNEQEIIKRKTKKKKAN